MPFLAQFVFVAEEGKYRPAMSPSRRLTFVQGHPASSVIIRRPPLTTYDCEFSYDLARQWIRQCGNEHSKCPKQLPTPFPTRVVHVGSDDLDPSLYISPFGAQGIYAALSYCWVPGKQPVMLTGSRLKSKSYAYPLARLTPTFQDVILISAPEFQ